MSTGSALRGKVAFVSGGSSDINLGVALGFAEAGAKIALISRSVEKIEAAARGLRDAGHDAIGMAADVRNFPAIDRALATTCGQWGEVDIVICPARHLALRRSTLPQHPAHPSFRYRQFGSHMIDAAPSPRGA